jgi:hypothetical protein
VEATFDGVTFTSLPNLPVVRAGHCLNIVSKKFLFFAGGEGSNREGIHRSDCTKITWFGVESRDTYCTEWTGLKAGSLIVV